MHFNKFQVLFLLCSVFFILRCADEKNPFTDFSLAQASPTHATFQNNDTISIFSSESLFVKIAVRELIDSFRIIAPKNRLNKDTCVIKKTLGAILKPGPYVFPFSFYDTGKTTIEVQTFRSNGIVVNQSYSLFCVSPLYQAQITGYFGTTFNVSTIAVQDTDVVYHWDFDNDNTISAFSRETSMVVLFSPQNKTSGNLWVSDPQGVCKSPKLPFTYYLTDNSVPRIVVNSGLVSGDTVLTGDKRFVLQLKIFDPSQKQPVFSATIDGKPFTVSDPPTFIYIIDSMDTRNPQIPVIVTAIDNNQYLNMAKDTFYLKYNDTIASVNNIRIMVTDPVNDSSISKVNNRVLFGKIEDFTKDSVAIILKARINGEVSRVTDTIRGRFNALWSMNCPLKNGANAIEIIACSMKNDSLASKSLYVYYDPTAKDTIPPVIFSITANDSNVLFGYTTTKDTAILKITTSDASSSIKAVYVNSDSLSSVANNNLVFMDTIPLRHTIKGNILTVKAVDNNNNETTVVTILHSNHVPVITKQPQFPQKLIAGGTYPSSIAFTDSDSDLVVLGKKSGTSSFSLDQTGMMLWKPVIADTGIQTVVISLFDGYDYQNFSLMSIVLPDTTSLPAPVRFTTSVADFPFYMEAGKDSLITVLRTKNDFGNTPLVFSARIVRPTRNELARDSLIVWYPALQDTGHKTILCTVTDAFNRSDTLSPSITIVPPNRPCSLLVTIPKSISRTFAGELDLSNTFAPETLVFSVHDQDLQAVERYTVNIRWPTMETQTALDSSRLFKVILRPKTSMSKVKDTLNISIADKAGHKDSLTFFMSYSNSIPGVFSGTIVINTRTSDVALTQPVFNFPLLVRLNSSYFPFNEVSTGGRNIRFKKVDGTMLPYEIERWDSASGIAEIWVKVDTIFAANESQNIKMVWNDSALFDGSKGKGVFDTALHYTGVWHMQDAASGTNKNSSQDIFAATPVGDSSIARGTGMIAFADSFFQNRYLSAGKLGIQKSITMSAWINPYNYGAGTKIICQALDKDTTPLTTYSLQATGSYPAPLQFKVGFLNANSGTATSEKTLPLNSWSHIAGTYDGNTIRFYLNGELMSTTVVVGELAPSNSPFTIASSGFGPAENFVGSIDEVRICKQAMTSDYFKLSYENQRAGSALVQFK